MSGSLLAGSGLCNQISYASSASPLFVIERVLVVCSPSGRDNRKDSGSKDICGYCANAASVVSMTTIMAKKFFFPLYILSSQSSTLHQKCTGAHHICLLLDRQREMQQVSCCSLSSSQAGFRTCREASNTISGAVSVSSCCMPRIRFRSRHNRVSIIQRGGRCNYYRAQS